MDERLKFVARLLDGEKMAGLCRVVSKPPFIPADIASRLISDIMLVLIAM
jgi:hypothetical protein